MFADIHRIPKDLNVSVLVSKEVKNQISIQTKGLYWVAEKLVEFLM